MYCFLCLETFYFIKFSNFGYTLLTFVAIHSDYSFLSAFSSNYFSNFWNLSFGLILFSKLSSFPFTFLFSTFTCHFSFRFPFTFPFSFVYVSFLFSISFCVSFRNFYVSFLIPITIGTVHSENLSALKILSFSFLKFEISPISKIFIFMNFYLI